MRETTSMTFESCWFFAYCLWQRKEWFSKQLEIYKNNNDTYETKNKIDIKSEHEKEREEIICCFINKCIETKDLFFEEINKEELECFECWLNYVAHNITQ